MSPAVATSLCLVIGILGNRGSGKDTLYHAFKAVEPTCSRYAFADALRSDLAPLLLEQFSIDVWNPTPEEKEFMRPLLMTYGTDLWRARDPDHWVKKVVEHIHADVQWGHPVIPVVTDVRFVNEATVLRQSFSGCKLVYVERKDGPPPTIEEEKHYRILRDMADVRVYWGGDTEEERIEVAKGLLAGWTQQ